MVKKIPHNKKRRPAINPGDAPIGAGASTQNTDEVGYERAAQKENQLTSAIKSKKGLENLDNDFVQQKVDKIFAANNTIKQKFLRSTTFSQFSRSKEYEELLKRIRKELREAYGVFQKQSDEFRQTLLKNWRDAQNEEQRHILVAELLATHQSTKERLPYYEEIYAKIATLQPKSIVDLGCGLNPLAYEYFVQQGLHPTVIASDVSKADLDFLQNCFKTMGIPGKTIVIDLSKMEDIERVSGFRGDVTFLFKLLDTLEAAKRNISYNIIDNIKTPIIIASFATKSLGGKKRIAVERRAWFEKLLKRKNLSWETFSVENELFYICRKNS